MAIAFRAPSSGDVHAPGATVAITKPAGTAGTDILVAFFGSGTGSGGTSGSFTAPAGWTAISAAATANLGAAQAINLAGFWSLGSNTNLTFTKTGTVADMGWVCLGFTGVDNTTPIDAVGTTNSSTGATTLTTNAVTVATSGAWHVIGFADWLGGTYSATGFTNVENAAANEAAGCLYNPTPKSTGSTGTVVVTSSAASSGQLLAGMPFALRPAAGGGSTAVLAAGSQASSVDFEVSNVPQAITGTLAAAAQAPATALAVAGTLRGTLAAAAGPAASALAVAGTLGSVLAPAAGPSSVALAVAGTLGGALAPAAQGGSAALAVLSVPPAGTSALAGSSGAAATALAALNIPPAGTGTLAASAGSPAAALAVLVVAAGDPAILSASAGGPALALAVTGTLGSTLAASSRAPAVGLAVLNTPPPVAGVLAGISGRASVGLAVLAAAASDTTVEPDLAASDVDAHFVVITAAVADPNLKQALVAEMKATPEIVGIVDQRIYPDGPPATAGLPSLSYTYVWARHATALDGLAGMAEYRVRFECRSLVAADNEALRLQVHHLFAGRIGDCQGVRIQFCTPEHELDKYIPPLPGSDNGTHYKRFDMRFKVREAVPTF